MIGAIRQLLRVATLAACGVVLVLPGRADAHAALVKSEPARRAALTKPPPQVRLWFNERIEPAYATVNLYNDGKPVVTGAPGQVDKADPKLLVLDLPPLAPGEYTVKYRVLSVDGHTVDLAIRSR